MKLKEKLIKRLMEIVSQYNESSENLKQYHLGRIHGITDACLYAGIHHIVTYSDDRNTATVKILYVEEGIR